MACLTSLNIPLIRSAINIMPIIAFLLVGAYQPRAITWDCPYQLFFYQILLINSLTMATAFGWRIRIISAPACSKHIAVVASHIGPRSLMSPQAGASANLASFARQDS